MRDVGEQVQLLKENGDFFAFPFLRQGDQPHDRLGTFFDAFMQKQPNSRNLSNHLRVLLSEATQKSKNPIADWVDLVAGSAQRVQHGFSVGRIEGVVDRVSSELLCGSKQDISRSMNLLFGDSSEQSRRVKLFEFLGGSEMTALMAAWKETPVMRCMDAFRRQAQGETVNFYKFENQDFYEACRREAIEEVCREIAYVITSSNRQVSAVVVFDLRDRLTNLGAKEEFKCQIAGFKSYQVKMQQQQKNLDERSEILSKQKEDFVKTQDEFRGEIADIDQRLQNIKQTEDGAPEGIRENEEELANQRKMLRTDLWKLAAIDAQLKKIESGQADPEVSPQDHCFKKLDRIQEIIEAGKEKAVIHDPIFVLLQKLKSDLPPNEAGRAAMHDALSAAKEGNYQKLLSVLLTLNPKMANTAELGLTPAVKGQSSASYYGLMMQSDQQLNKAMVSLNEKLLLEGINLSKEDFDKLKVEKMKNNLNKIAGLSVFSPGQSKDAEAMALYPSRKHFREREQKKKSVMKSSQYYPSLCDNPNQFKQKKFLSYGDALLRMDERDRKRFKGQVASTLFDLQGAEESPMVIAAKAQLEQLTQLVESLAKQYDVEHGPPGFSSAYLNYHIDRLEADDLGKFPDVAGRMPAAIATMTRDEVAQAQRAIMEYSAAIELNGGQNANDEQVELSGVMQGWKTELSARLDQVSRPPDGGGSWREKGRRSNQLNVSNPQEMSKNSPLGPGGNRAA